MPQLSRIVSTIRAAIAANDFPGADRPLRNYCHDNGVTPQTLEALSGLARGSLAAHRFAKTADYARRAHRLLVRRLENADLDSEPSLASALGASIEALAQLKGRPGPQSSDDGSPSGTGAGDPGVAWTQTSRAIEAARTAPC
jgi:hypothetical protein